MEGNKVEGEEVKEERREEGKGGGVWALKQLFMLTLSGIY